MSEKANMSKEAKQQLREEVNSLLSSLSGEDQTTLVLDSELTSKTKIESEYDFNKMSEVFTKKAREITDSLFNNFVDIGVFDKNDYAKHKKELDTINISNLFFQLKTLKIVIIKVMEDITTGNTSPRLIEVLCQLQDKLAEITKAQANYIIFLEQTYKNLNNDNSVNKETDKISSSPGEGQFFITVGTKNMIRSLPAFEKNEDTPVNSLVNPNNKSELMKTKNITVESENLDDFIDITELL